MLLYFHFFIYQGYSVGKSLIEKNSGKIISNVSKKLNFLVVGEKPTNRKVQQAKNLGIKILTQKEWSDLLN